MEINLDDNLWQLFNKYSINGVMIISHNDFKNEIERICIQSKVSNDTILTGNETEDKDGSRD